MSARSVGSKQGDRNGFATEEAILANGVTGTDGDFVKQVPAGDLTVTTASIASGELFGVIQGAGSSNLTQRSYKNSQVGDGVATNLIELAAGMRYELPVSASLATDAVGSYYKLTGASGAQQVDNATKSATVGQLICRKRVATNAAGTQFLKGWFEVAALPEDTTIA